MKRISGNLYHVKFRQPYGPIMDCSVIAETLEDALGIVQGEYPGVALNSISPAVKTSNSTGLVETILISDKVLLDDSASDQKT